MNFDEKVKYIRVKLNLTQEQLARELNVNFATINRWASVYLWTFARQNE